MVKLISTKNLLNSSAGNGEIYRISTNASLPPVLRKSEALIINDEQQEIPAGYGLVLSKKPREGCSTVSEDLWHLTDGDVVRVDASRNLIRALYRKNANANFLFVTERCNSFCLMCSQPPRDVDDGHLIEELINAVPLFDPSTKELGITGGEPTLLGDRFIELLRAIKNHLPNTAVHVLSNGRTASSKELVVEIAKLRHPDLMFGIPLYSDIASKHDFVVQAKGAFDETIRGILNLKAYSQKVEIRVVLHKQTYERLPDLARFIVRNLKFVDHVALMGLEITGFTRANLDELWIDPLDYQDQLEEAVNILNSAGLRTSVYNLQLCLLPQSLWEFSVKSISDWKNKYYPECSGCSERYRCGGFFESSDLKRSPNIRALSFKNP
jgi:His-Xaa-Ser system radical SAM maturase HxsC